MAWFSGIAAATGVAEYKVQEITMFFRKFDFAVVDEANAKVKINSDFQEFLTRA